MFSDRRNLTVCRLVEFVQTVKIRRNLVRVPNLYFVYNTVGEPDYITILHFRSVAVDMTIYVITPMRRASAEAVHLMMTHALGEAGATSLVRKKHSSNNFTEKYFLLNV